MRILHVSPSFYPAYVYGGPVETTYQLCKHLSKQGCTVRVLTTNANGSRSTLKVRTDREVSLDFGVQVRYCARQLLSSTSLSFLYFLPSYIRWADVVHLHAVYSFPTIPTLAFCRMFRKPLIWSPRGALQYWKGTKKRNLKKLWDKICKVVKPEVLVLHLTSIQEAKESLKKIPSSRSVVIPHGVDIPLNLPSKKSDPVSNLRLLYLGRLAPEKGLENLIEACAQLRNDNIRLTIAGGGDKKYAMQLRHLVSANQLHDIIRMIGYVRPEQRRRLFMGADVLVVPSHAENFGMVIAEALAHAVPVVASKGTPWKELEERKCGLWVDNDPLSLAKAIERIRAMPLREMGQKGREWMKKEFNWEDRARKFINLYAELLVEGQGARD